MEQAIQQHPLWKTTPEFSYYISKQLRKHWHKFSLKSMKQINRDRVIIIDGSEGVGKSTWAFQQALFLDPKMFETPEKFVSRIAFTPEEFFELVRTTKNGVVIFDEAFRGFSSRAALSKVNKKLVSALMEMRQNNNIVFIVLPSFFLLDIYPAMLRSNTLFNIYYEKNSGKRAWRGYNKKDKNAIYQKGVKKGWIYSMNSIFKDRFFPKFPGGDKYYEAYENKKSKALRDMDLEDSGKSKIYRKSLSINEVLLLKSRYKILKSLRKLAEECQNAGLDYSYEHLRKVFKNFDENELKNTEKQGI